MLVTATLILALLLDQWLGEPKRYHPLVGFGALAHWVEQILWTDRSSTLLIRFRGVVAWTGMVMIPVCVLTFLTLSLDDGIALFILNVLVLYFCIGGKSLQEHAQRIIEPLKKQDLPAARQAVAMIVGRDTETMDQDAVTRATLESVLENGSDGVIAPLLWFVLAGAPGALLYRLANTLDASWGYRNERFRDFGWAAAKIDDLLNLLPARVCAIGYGVSGQLIGALQCWRYQGCLTDSPNAGVTMASGAGALGVEVGGDVYYSGMLHKRPRLGCGYPASIADIERGLKLLTRCIIFWVLLFGLLEGLI